jgi:hypothetical protein
VRQEKNALVSASIALMMEAVGTSETSVSFNESSRRNIPEDSHLRRIRNSYKVWSANLKERDYLGDLGVDERIIKTAGLR